MLLKLEFISTEGAMHRTALEAQDCLNRNLPTLAGAGNDLWFLDQQAIESDSRKEAFDALAIFTGAALDQEQETAPGVARTTCLPTYCASCAGAALCGNTFRTYIN
jgi:hypothetical protein